MSVTRGNDWIRTRLTVLICVLACWAILPPARAACNAPGVADYGLVINGTEPASPVYVPVGTSATFKAVVEADNSSVNAITSPPQYRYEFKWSNTVLGASTTNYTQECSVTTDWTEPGLKSVWLMASNPPHDFSTNDFCLESNGWKVYVLKVDVLQAETNVCWKMPTGVLSLTNSYWAAEAGGTVKWKSNVDGDLPGADSPWSFTPTNLTPTTHVFTAYASLLTNCLDTCTVRVLKVDILQAETNVCWRMTNATLGLPPSSYDGGGGFEWSSSPTGLSPSATGSGTSFAFNPSLSAPATYVVTARASLLTNCLDVCTVTVFKVDYALDHVCVITSHPPHEVAVTTTPSPLPAGVAVDLELNGATAAAIFTNSGASTIAVTGTTNLAVLGTLASDPVSNMVMEAKWAGSVCTSVAFTVVDVVSMTGTEALHPNNTKSDTTQADETNAVLVCQASNDTARLELGLAWLPAAYPASNMLWKACLTNGQAAGEWGGPGDFTTNPTNLTWTPGAASNREFRLYGWFDCEAGNYTNTEPHRVLDVTVVELAGLAISNAAGTNAVTDLTRADEPAAAANTLYLCEGSNGTAAMAIRADWLPATVGGDKFRWEIVQTNGAPLTQAQWAPNDQTFGLNPATGVVWSATGPTNREFLVRAWYDCNGNGARDDDEPHRSAFVTVLKVELTEIKGLRKSTVGDFTQEADAHAAGRLFIDTKETWGGGTLDSAHYDKQRVKLTVEVQPNTLPPGDFKIRWEVRDPDDPATHTDIDANGSGGDNAGKAHEGESYWFTQADHTISDQANATAVDETTVIGEAKTALSVVGGKLVSTVFFNFSDDGGDNFLVKAVLVKGSDDLCHDNSGTLTVWRKRAVEVHAMTKPNDDVQVHAVGSTPGASVVIITPGPNGLTDTTILAGDDRRTGDSIHAGANGVAETTANSGGNRFYPSADGTLNSIQSALRTGYANADPNHNCYFDPVCSDGALSLPYAASVDRLTTGVGSLSKYIRDNFHATDNTHADNTVEVIGFADVAGVYGTARQAPHVAISLRTVLKGQSVGDDDIGYNDVHEMGHVVHGSLAGNLLHDNHTGGAFQDDCAFEEGTGHGTEVCEKHVRFIRNNVARSWKDHDATTVNYAADTMDSD